MTGISHRDWHGVSVLEWLGGESKAHTTWFVGSKWLGGSGLEGLIGQVDPMGKG